VQVDGSVWMEIQQGELLVQLAETEEKALANDGHRDIWMDPAALKYLQRGRSELWWSPAFRKTVVRRVKPYQWQQGKVYRVMADGSRREVPPPSERYGVCHSTHGQCGHFGEKRTTSLVQANFWWYGLYKDVCAMVRSCELCRRVNAAFTAQSPQLNPLPIEGLFYRWGVDLFGPVAKSAQGNCYCMIAIEHFSKHCELIPIPGQGACHYSKGFPVTRYQPLCFDGPGGHG
jgi:hypothetical protein